MSTHSIENRPQIFAEVRGQEEAVQLLTGMVKRPDLLPKAVILSGPFGNGKTTLARIFARALICTHGGRESRPCSVCTFDAVQGNGKYQELNSASLTRIEEIPIDSNTCQVVMLDEAHLLKDRLQGELLKPLETANDRLTFIFCTTNAEKLQLPLRSRCFDIRLNLMSDEDLKICILANAKKSNVQIEESAALELGRQFLGHARDAVQGLQRMCIHVGDREITRDDVLKHLGTPSEQLTLQLLKVLIGEGPQNMEPILRRMIQKVDTYLLPSYWRRVFSDVIRIEHGENPPHISSSLMDEYVKVGKICQETDRLWKLARLLCQPELDQATTPDHLYLLLSWMRGILNA